MGYAHITPEDRQEIRRMADAGHPYRSIAAKFSIPTRAVDGIVFRQRHGPRMQAPRPKPAADRAGASHSFKDIEPAKYPFAADSSCPAFAHDEVHLAAVFAARKHGFPVAFGLKRPRYRYIGR